MINEAFPFDDPKFKKAITEKEKGTNVTQVDEYETIDSIYDNNPADFTISTSDSLNSIISAAPKIPKSASNMILDASAISQNQKEVKAKEMSDALSQVMTKYNEKYGTDLTIDFNNLSKTLVNVSDPSTRQTLELYVSEVFKSIRPVMLLHLISRLSLALDYVLQPERMFDSSQLSIPDLFLVIEKLQQYIVGLNEIIDSSTIKDSDQILKKLAEENKELKLDDPESQAAVDSFLALMKSKSGITA